MKPRNETSRADEIALRIYILADANVTDRDAGARTGLTHDGTYDGTHTVHNTKLYVVRQNVGKTGGPSPPMWFRSWGLP